MKRIGIATFAAGLLLATAVFGQEHRGGGGGVPHGGGGAPHGSGGGMPHGSGGGMPHGGGMSMGFHGGAESVHSHSSLGGGSSFGVAHQRSHFTTGHLSGEHVSVERHMTGTERSSHKETAIRTGETRETSHSHNTRGFGTRPSNWNNRPHDFNRATYQRNVTAGHRFHYGSYHRPSGWYYRRWAYGEDLPSLFWARDYWIGDWWLFDLPIPPYGYEWVRYGDDAILVNVYTGEILEVEYGVFY
jgi:Ni/Co efflux regulator RcnB